MEVEPGSTEFLATVAARELAGAGRIFAGVGLPTLAVDLARRTVNPHLEPVYESVRRTGRLVLVSEAPAESSVTSEIATRVQRDCFYSLEAPVLRATGFDAPYPPSRLDDAYLPDLDRVLDGVDRALAH